MTVKSNPYFGVKTVGEFVKAFRAKHGYSQDGLAKAFDPPKSKSLVNNVEQEMYKLPFEFIKAMYPLLTEREKDFVKELVAHIAVGELND